MRTVYKYPLIGTGVRSIRMPSGAQLLAVQVQGDTPMLWALVDDAMHEVGRMVNVYGTGWRVSGSERYLTTFQQPPFVWHVFDGGE